MRPDFAMLSHFRVLRIARLPRSRAVLPARCPRTIEPMGIITKLLRWLRGPAGPEEEAEAQRMHAERERVREEQLSRMGPHGIPGMSSGDDDVTDPRRR